MCKKGKRRLIEIMHNIWCRSVTWGQTSDSQILTQTSHFNGKRVHIQNKISL